MKIAQVIPLMKTIPPEKYGGIERIATWLTNDLLSAGHEVTLFAARGSTLQHKNLKIEVCSPYPTFDHMKENRKWEIQQFKKVIAMQDEFDILHFHYEPFILQQNEKDIKSKLLQELRIPTVFTFHNTTYIPQRIEYYKIMPQKNNFHFVFISENQRKPLAFLPNTHVIYNGIPIDHFLFNDSPEQYLLFLGRITPIKGIQDAIKIALYTNKKLLIAAKVDGEGKQFYENEVKPYINDSIVNLGEVEKSEKVNILKNAKALLFPIHWEEPFGLVMAEAMACGTPVIAYARGSVPEIIKDGETGFIVNESNDNKTGNWIEKTSGITGLSEAVKRLYALPPEPYKNMRLESRQCVEKNFQAKTMCNNYQQLYQKVLKNKI